MPLWMRRKRHQFLDTDAVVSLPKDPEDILSTAGILNEEPTMLAVGDKSSEQYISNGRGPEQCDPLPHIA